MKVPMTQKGYERLREELNRLKKVERPQVITAIAEAREHGDLSENAEYHAAKEKQGFVEGRIAELQGKLANAQVIDISKLKSEKVVFGATVVLQNLDDNSTKRYTLVGQDESDLENGKISVQSPVGRSLLQHIVGDTVVVNVPAGKVEYEILEIRFEEI